MDFAIFSMDTYFLLLFLMEYNDEEMNEMA